MYIYIYIYIYISLYLYNILLSNKSCFYSQHNEKYSTVCYYHVAYEFQSESTPYNLPECQG